MINDPIRAVQFTLSELRQAREEETAGDQHMLSLVGRVPFCEPCLSLTR